jgi:hypothetical protein
VEARFSVPVQTGPWDPPSLVVQWIPALSQGSNCRGMALTTYPHLALRLKKWYSYTPMELYDMLQVELYLHGTFISVIMFYVL